MSQKFKINKRTHRYSDQEKALTRKNLCNKELLETFYRKTSQTTISMAISGWTKFIDRNYQVFVQMKCTGDSQCVSRKTRLSTYWIAL